MTILHAGGKFDSDSYAVSGGLHGVGISVVNALSSRLEVEIDRDGKEYQQTYPYAKPGPLEGARREPPDRHHDHVLGRPAIFETTEYNVETVSRRLQEMAFLNKGLTITLRDERRTGVSWSSSTRSARPPSPWRPPRKSRRSRGSRSSGSSTTRAGWSITSST